MPHRPPRSGLALAGFGWLWLGFGFWLASPRISGFRLASRSGLWLGFGWICFDLALMLYDFALIWLDLGFIY